MRRSKYGNKITEVDGIKFHSAKEAARYGELKLLESAGEITGLRLQVPYKIKIKGVKICTYYADFVYVDINKRTRKVSDSEVVVEDVKGMKTPVYRIKKKLVEAIYGITITEV